MWGLVACVLGLVVVFITIRRRTKRVWETTPGRPYTVIATDDEIICEHPKRSRESIRWDDVTEIRLVTTSEGPFHPDMWFVFIGDQHGCSVPSEAKGFEQLWDVFKNRFPGMEHEAIISAGTSDGQKTLWKKGSNQMSHATSGTALGVMVSSREV